MSRLLQRSSAATVRTTFANTAAVTTAMLQKLKGSKLTADDGRKLRLQAYTAQQVAALNSLPVYRAGFRIPYFDLDGRLTKFFRFRYLEYGAADGGFKAMVAGTAKQFRYAQPEKTLPELYLPPFIDWRSYAADATKPLLITEGELKSACSTRHGLPCVGLGGVWSFKSTLHNMPLLPMLKQFVWKDRTVYIVYDSDAVSNEQVVKAENALARELFNLGAAPYVVRLPALKNEGKTGLDDYILELGVDDLMQNVLPTGVEYAAYQELLALNEEVLYVEDPGLILRLTTMQRLSARAFVDHAYSTRVYYQQQEGKNGPTMVEKSAPREWLKWPHRATVGKVTYRPGEGRVVQGYFNCWQGWAIAPAVTSSPKLLEPWHELLDYLFAGVDQEYKTWFEQWLAYPLQHPGCKLYSAAVLWGIHHGTGKSLVGYTMFKIYGENATEIGDRDLYSAHNEWAEHKQFVMGDEITGGDKRHAADQMKSMITQKLIRLNPKYVPSYTVPDCINYYFTSNHPDAFFIEDTDRRFFIHEVRGTPRDDSFYQKYMEWLDRGGGAGILFHHLLHLDTSGFNAQGHAPITQSKKDMIEAGRSDLGQWVSRLRQDPDHVLKLGLHPLKFTLYTSDELRAVYDPDGKTKVTTNGMARELKRGGFLQVNGNVPIMTKLGLQRLWCVRGDIAKIMAQQPAKVAALYDEERKTGPAKKEKF